MAMAGSVKNTSAGKRGIGAKSKKAFTICMAIIVSVVCLCIEYVMFSHMADRRRAESVKVTLLEPVVSVAVAETAVAVAEPVAVRDSGFDDAMRDINPDYVCWLKIDGTDISYPVVRGDDNELYLGVDFYGEENRFGSIFMDYRCVGSYVPNIIVFGHNSRDGGMFGGLRNFLDETYLAGHPVITLVVDGRAVGYEIFSARKSDTGDPAYCLGFDGPDAFGEFAGRCGAPDGVAQVLTLSTCVSGDNKDERVIIQARLA